MRLGMPLIVIFLCVQPVNHPTITAVAVCEKKVWQPEVCICHMTFVTHIECM